jgi:TonB family protein
VCEVYKNVTRYQMSNNSCNEFVPTIIDTRPLLPRLALELTALKQECERAWPEFKRHPVHAAARAAAAAISRSRRVLLAPHVLAALTTVGIVVGTVVLMERALAIVIGHRKPDEVTTREITVMLDLTPAQKTSESESIGRNSSGRVGFRQGRGEGFGEVKDKSKGGGGGGAGEKLPQQTGKLAPPSNVLAAIPKTPTTHIASLPVAGMDIDPALWKDIKAPVFGDPRSTSTASSKGPGEGEGMGTNRGLGIGDGDGPGFGPGSKGNTGGGEKQTGCCGESGGGGDNTSPEKRIFRGAEVEQRARLLLKPEPQYSEDARRNQISGTVMLRVVFASDGQVQQIRAVQTLPFGLTERAIAAAKMIKFVPAMKGGRPVSMYMQLEYNFNLY